MYRFNINSVLQSFLIALSVLTFTLKYNLYWASFSIFVLLTFLYLFKNSFRIKTFNHFQTLIFFYLFFTIIGINTPAFWQDLRLLSIWLLLLVLFYNFLVNNEVTIKGLIRILFVISIIILAYYLLVFFKIINNIYQTEQLASYQNYRILGPPLFTFYIIPFCYSLFSIKKDRIFHLTLLVGITACLLNGSLQHLTIFLLSYFVAYLNGNNTRKYISKIIGTLILIVLFFFVVFQKMDARYQEKLKEAINPLNSSTVQTRINDLQTIWPSTVSNPIHVMFGQGIGVNSVIKRINKFDPKLTEERVFLEIDNGFFYVFHRSGLIGLIVVICIHLHLVKQIKNRSAKIIFITYFLVTNLLSYHYWVNVASPLIIAMVLYRKFELGNEKIKQ